MKIIKIPNRTLKHIEIGKLSLKSLSDEKYLLTVKDKSGVDLAQELTPQQILDLLSMLQQILR